MKHILDRASPHALDSSRSSITPSRRIALCKITDFFSFLFFSSSSFAIYDLVHSHTSNNTPPLPTKKKITFYCSDQTCWHTLWHHSIIAVRSTHITWHDISIVGDATVQPFTHRLLLLSFLFLSRPSHFTTSVLPTLPTIHHRYQQWRTFHPSQQHTDTPLHTIKHYLLILDVLIESH